MGRRRKQGCAKFDPEYIDFKPRGVKLSHLDEVVLSTNEVEALKLHELDRLNHVEAAMKMGLSQPTFTRILNESYKKLASAVLLGKHLKLSKNHHTCEKCEGENESN